LHTGMLRIIGLKIEKKNSTSAAERGATASSES
jgi:hypothetical protein